MRNRKASGLVKRFIEQASVILQDLLGETWSYSGPTRVKNCCEDVLDWRCGFRVGPGEGHCQ